MIFNSTSGTTAASPWAVAVEEEAVASRVYQVAASGTPPPVRSFEGFLGDQVVVKQVTNQAMERFDWTDKKVLNAFIRLEQKVLAKKATADDKSLYESMKRNRNAEIFAERYVLDYAEVQRLKILAEKLAEIQRYLRPIEIG